MVRPEFAPVRPRVWSPESGQTLLLEDEIRRHVQAGASGFVGILGPPGSGKSVALRHLHAAVPGNFILADLNDGEATTGVPTRPAWSSMSPWRPALREASPFIASRRGGEMRSLSICLHDIVNAASP